MDHQPSMQIASHHWLNTVKKPDELVHPNRPGHHLMDNLARSVHFIVKSLKPWRRGSFVGPSNPNDSTPPKNAAKSMYVHVFLFFSRWVKYKFGPKHLPGVIPFFAEFGAVAYLGCLQWKAPSLSLVGVLLKLDNTSMFSFLWWFGGVAIHQVDTYASLQSASNSSW